MDTRGIAARSVGRGPGRNRKATVTTLANRRRRRRRRRPSLAIVSWLAYRAANREPRGPDRLTDDMNYIFCAVSPAVDRRWIDHLCTCQNRR